MNNLKKSGQQNLKKNPLQNPLSVLHQRAQKAATATNPGHVIRGFWPRLAAAACALLCWSVSLGTQAQNPQPSLQLPHLGDSADLSPSQERRLGDAIVAGLWRDPAYVDDAALQAYAESIWQPLIESATQRGDVSEELKQHFALRLLLGRNASINAFALPGGWVGVHLGLIAAVDSRDELASVLAHELSHITQRHIARMSGHSVRSAPLVLASLVLGALAASKNPDAAQALIVGGQAAAQQQQLSFSRDMEREADRIGFQILSGAGFEPEGAVRMFAKLEHASRLNDRGAWPYLRTHPLSSERMADMQMRTQHAGLAAVVSTPEQREISQAWAVEHAMVAARAAVLAQPLDRLHQWAAQPVSGAAFEALPLPQQTQRLYASALALQRLRDVSAALQRWRALSQKLAQALNAPSGQMSCEMHFAHMGWQRQRLWLGGELMLSAGQPKAAVALLQEIDGLEQEWATQLKNQAFTSTCAHMSHAALQTTLQSIAQRPTLMLRARVALALGTRQDIQAAADALGTWVALHPSDALAWQQAALLWQHSGQPLRSLWAQGEEKAAQLDWQGAADRFTAAQDAMRQLGTQATAADYVQASIVDTRLRAMQQLLREQARE